MFLTFFTMAPRRNQERHWWAFHRPSHWAHPAAKAYERASKAESEGFSEKPRQTGHLPDLETSRVRFSAECACRVVKGPFFRDEIEIERTVFAPIFARLRGKDRSRPAQQAEYNGGEDRPQHLPFRAEFVRLVA